MHQEARMKEAYCSSYCDVQGRYVTGRTCMGRDNVTNVYCCGTPTHKFCCEDVTMDIGKLPGVTTCTEDLSVKVTNMLPWIPILILMAVAYPIMRKCKCRREGQSTPSTVEADAEHGSSEEEEVSNPPSPVLPPSYDYVTAKPPPYEQVCGLVNLGFSVEDIENGSDTVRVHNITTNMPAAEVASTSHTNLNANSESTVPHQSQTVAGNTHSSDTVTVVQIESTGEGNSTATTMSPEVEVVMPNEPPPPYSEIPCARI